MQKEPLQTTSTYDATMASSDDNDQEIVQAILRDLSELKLKEQHEDSDQNHRDAGNPLATWIKDAVVVFRKHVNDDSLVFESIVH